MREYLVIEDSWKNGVFATPEQRNSRGYFPRDVAEKLFKRSMAGTIFFKAEEGKIMRNHPEWRDNLEEQNQ